MTVVSAGETLDVDTTWFDSATDSTVSGSVLYGGSDGTVHMPGVFTVIATIVDSGGVLDVLFGGVSDGSVLTGDAYRYDPSYGRQYVYGLADDTVVSSGGSNLVESGGVASGTIVSSGGADEVASGGVAIDTVVSSGGAEFLASGGVANGAVVRSGGDITLPLMSAYGPWSADSTNVIDGLTVQPGASVFLNIYAGGSVFGFVTNNFETAAEVIFSGGMATGTEVINGGSVDVESGGLAIGTIGSGGSVIVYSGGVATGTVIYPGGAEFVQSGGVESGADFMGLEAVDPGGVAIGTVISSGELAVDSGGVTRDTVVIGGEEFVTGVASDTVVSGGSEVLFSSGVATGTVVSSGGKLSVEAGGVASNTVVSGGGSEVLFPGGTATDTTLLGGGMLDVGYLPYVSGGSATVNPTTDVLTVFDGSQTYTQQLSGNYTSDSFALTPDAATGTNVTADPEPTLSDYLSLSSAVYTTAGAEPVSPTGWTLIDFESTTNGMQTAAFQNISSHEIVIAYEGTNLANVGSLSDYKSYLVPQLTADGDIAIGISPVANLDALDFANSIALIADGNPIYLTGHSLGGEEAEYVEYQAGLTASDLNITGGTTFGAPGVPQLSTTDNYKSFDNYMISTDPVTLFGGSHVGNPVTLKPVSYLSNIFLSGLLDDSLLGALVADGVSALTEHILYTYGQALKDAGDISANPVPQPFFALGDLHEIYNNIDNFLSGTDASGDLVESGTITNTTSNGTVVTTLNETTTLSGATTLNVQEIAGISTLEQTAKISVSGVVTADDIALNGTAIDTSLSDPPDINVGADGSLLVGVPSSQLGDEISITGNTDGSVTVMVGGDASSAAQEVMDFAASEFSGDALDISQSGVTDDITVDIESGKTVEVAADYSVASIVQDFVFTGSQGTLKLDDPSSFSGIIGGFVPGDTLDLVDVPFDSSGSATVISGDVLQITEGGQSYDLNGNFFGGAFNLVTDGTDGSLITLSRGTVDDYRNTYNGTNLPLGNVEVGGTTTGDIDYVGDKDVFAVMLTAGTHYTLNLDGYDISSSYSLRDPYLQLLDSSGNLLAASDDLSSANFSSEIDYTAAVGGTYYLAAASSPSDGTYTTGNYQIRASTPADLAIGAAATGAIDYVADRHAYEVMLTAGTRYAFNLDGYDVSSSYTLRDPYLQLLDSSGNVLAVSDDINARNFGSEIDYTAATGGTYYLEAASSPSDGTYTTGSYQIRSSTPADLAIGTTATGEISYVGDRHAYQVTLTAGTRYAFNLDGYDTSSSYSLRDPYLQLLDSAGNLLTGSDDISAANWSSEIDYTAVSSGTYYLEASSSPSDGTYTIGTYQVRAVDPPLATTATGSGSTNIPASNADQILTAGAAPEVFDFTNVSFGNDTIIGFDPAHDALRLSSGIVDNFGVVQSDMSATAAGTLITFDAKHSVTVRGVASDSLTATNFRFA